MILVVALSGVGLAVALWLLVTGIRPAPPSERNQLWSQATSWLAGWDRRRVGCAAAGALGALVVVRWPVAVVAGGAAGWFVPLPGERAARRQVEARTEAIAQWCEQLRDTAGTARGIEAMLVATARSAPRPIRPEVTRMARRLENEPLDQVLDGLAEDLAHPIGDMVVVALRLATTAGSRRVRSVLDQLAVSASRSAAMRRRVDVARARPRSATRLVALVVAGFVVCLLALARDYLAPYGTAVGQFVLVGIGVYWGLGFFWMWHMGRIPEPPRFLVRSRSAETSAAQLSGARP